MAVSVMSATKRSSLPSIICGNGYKIYIFKFVLFIHHQAIQADGEKLMSESTIGTDEIAAHLKSLIDNWEELKSLSEARASRSVLK